MRKRIPDILRVVAFLLTAYGTIGTFANLHSSARSSLDVEQHLHASVP